MELKKIVFGEKMPDKDDPQYKEKREQGVKAGQTFARKLRLDKLAAKVQLFATNHPKLFLGIVFGFLLLSVVFNLYRISTAVRYRCEPSSAVERQEQQLRFNRHHPQSTLPNATPTTGHTKDNTNINPEPINNTSDERVTTENTEH